MMKKCCWLYASNKMATYSACFIGKTLQELIDEFNEEVKREEVTQDRLYYREALVNAIEEHGIDVNVVRKKDGLCFDHFIRLDEEGRTLCQ